ncbi:EamA family transporter [Ramlibacter ginsenosidimutans]|uniref:EamA family transporter n=1 Tax=Ramlibacter ginsenosidimutans TaxID=502333 RepID=A0A934WNL7_9BURK|nr:EamA family transporter [Ramlibacter ginsenosidimutans]MBK6007352.1 EamA family transporter [Ramlibacter ginsenosidimutans]
MSAQPAPTPASTARSSAHAASAARPFTRGELLSALAIVVIWGTNFVVMKTALRHFTPLQLGAGRYLFAVLPLLFFVRPPRLHWKWVVLYGLTQGLGQFGFLFTALRAGMTASLASVLMQTQVFFTAIFGFVLLRERPARPLQVGLALAAAALACFALPYLLPHAVAAAGSVTAVGLVLNLCSAACWGASNIVARKAQAASTGFDPLSLVVWASVVPVLPFMGLSLWLDAPDARWHWLQADAWSWAAVAYLGWVATIAAYGMWTALLKKHPANRVAPFSLGVPVVGIAAGMGLLGEVLSGWQWAGIVLVAAALGCVMFWRRR